MIQSALKPCKYSMVCNVFRIVDFGSFWGKPNYEVAFALVNTTRNFVFVQPYPTLHSVLSLVTVRFFDENYLLSLLQYGLFSREGRYADNGLCYFTYIDKVLMQTQVIC